MIDFGRKNLLEIFSRYEASAPFGPNWKKMKGVALLFNLVSLAAGIGVSKHVSHKICSSIAAQTWYRPPSLYRPGLLALNLTIAFIAACAVKLKTTSA